MTQALLEAEAAAVGNALPKEAASLIYPNPTAPKFWMDELMNKFAGSRQQCVYEFLTELVNFLHDKLVVAGPAAGVVLPTDKYSASQWG